MSDEPNTQRSDRLTAGGRRTDDGRWSTLLVVHEPDGTWTIQLDAPGVTLTAEDMVLLAEAILVRAR